MTRPPSIVHHSAQPLDPNRVLYYTTLMVAIRRTDVFATWLKALRDRAGAARIEIRIKRLELGNPGDHRNLKGGVSELRIDFGPGYRVYYTERNGEIIILLCGGDKKSQQGDIAQAIAMIGDLED